MENITCKGFKAAGIAAGIKKNGQRDLGLIFSETPAAVAGVFTRNRVQAAPVLLDRRRIAAGVCQALVVNSGNANCCTGPQGMRDAEAAAAAVAAALDIAEETVLVASTGVIGQPLPVDKIQSAAPDLTAALRPDGIDQLAAAIMTTDTRPKVAAVHSTIAGRPFALVGTAKGAGMINPDMATMLCFVCTDVDAPAGVLQQCLHAAAAGSFNRITIDGDTSTNDTILLMANGRSGVALDRPAHVSLFQSALNEVLVRLAKACVRDGEGVTKLVEVTVRGASSDRDARRIADTIANSPLVKTAFFGEDANWGRIFAAAGRAGAELDPQRLDLFFNDVQMADRGMGCGAEAEADATRVLKLPEFAVTLDLNLGRGSASVLTCDFSVDYVRINADYRS